MADDAVVEGVDPADPAEGAAVEAEDAEDEEALTDAEKLAIASHFLLNAPPGEFDEVLGDVRALMPEGVLSDAMSRPRRPFASPRRPRRPPPAPSAASAESRARTTTNNCERPRLFFFFLATPRPEKRKKSGAWRRPRRAGGWS